MIKTIIHRLRKLETLILINNSKKYMFLEGNYKVSYNSEGTTQRESHSSNTIQVKQLSRRKAIARVRMQVAAYCTGVPL